MQKPCERRCRLNRSNEPRIGATDEHLRKLKKIRAFPDDPLKSTGLMRWDDTVAECRHKIILICKQNSFSLASRLS
jgi:hypothetical protein